MMRIILENGGLDLEQFLNSDPSKNMGKYTNDIFRQYLKNKENEISEGGSGTVMGQLNSEGQGNFGQAS